MADTYSLWEAQPGNAIADAESVSPVEVLLGELQQRCVAQGGATRIVVLMGPAILHEARSDVLGALHAGGAHAKVDVQLRPGQIDRDYWPSLIELDFKRGQSVDACRIALRAAVEDWRPDSLIEGRGHRIGALLFSDAPLADIARHIENVAIQQRSDRPGQRLLGLADPAAFEGVWRVCRDDQRARLLGPIARWCTVDRWGKLTDHVCAAATALAATHARFLGFDDAQWIALSHVRPINRAWARMRAGGGVVRYDDFVRLDESVRRARQYGLTDPADLELFALHALESGPDFDLHPLAQALLRDRPEDVYYSRAIAELDGTQWDEIRKAHRGIHQLIEE
ncbi:hypothetical protein BFR06_11155 [Burkholderia pseudomallei]|uniref:hypothetical protein n=1 Tax=Burkholderia pseudomallei TaxID=28450 RepID=UPI0004204F22|nr:hypothetical protein [Burkholderia pseudomallei]AIP21449.1 hypothetical protein DP63_2724 [Burkholderia pseudomallei MSHR5855]AIP41136.1 hypothetical protein DP65_276 [Burkholderia pseudomallei MSHR5848]APF92319.1 hypothetical protein BFR05_11150 [Burkholderia pseudomallei]APF98364.1 hypothetical protein BFR06_11155 [Burkholderia pseudomallei]KEO67377.1 hypothetical protein J103_22645 [Burkholderia pseudomallei MSHR5855]